MFITLGLILGLSVQTAGWTRRCDDIARRIGSLLILLHPPYNSRVLQEAPGFLQRSADHLLPIQQ